MWENMIEPGRPRITIKYGAEKLRCADTEIIVTLLLFHGNNGYAKAPHCYVISILHASLMVYFTTHSVNLTAYRLSRLRNGIERFWMKDVMV